MSAPADTLPSPPRAACRYGPQRDAWVAAAPRVDDHSYLLPLLPPHLATAGTTRSVTPGWRARRCRARALLWAEPGWGALCTRWGGTMGMPTWPRRRGWTQERGGESSCRPAGGPPCSVLRPALLSRPRVFRPCRFQDKFPLAAAGCLARCCYRLRNSSAACLPAHASAPGAPSLPAGGRCCLPSCRASAARTLWRRPAACCTPSEGSTAAPLFPHAKSTTRG
jgi:hypothetical protein